MSILKAAVESMLLNHLSSFQSLPVGLRVRLLRRLGLTIGDGAVILSHCWWGGREVTVGRDVFIGTRCLFDTTAPITIGDRVAIAAEVSIVTGNHRLGPSHHRTGADDARAVVIEEGCGIGARAVILPGVTVRRGCVIGAGSVVAADTDADGLYLGVPARRVRNLAEAEVGSAIRGRRTPSDLSAAS
jgi:maltose O-acetyltransferase